jgi:fused signal recognition particle receptor
MAGFFKKLFNRITGKPAEEAAPVEEELVALPAPEPVVEIEPPKVVAKKPAAKKVEVKKVEKAKPAAKVAVKPAVKPKTKVAAAPPKKVDVKKPVAKVLPPQKAEAKKPEPKKPVAKKPEPKVKAQPAPAAKVVVAPPPVISPRATLPAPPPPPPPQIVVAPPAPAPVMAVEPEAPQRGGWFSRLKEGLSKSSKTITGSITAIFTKRKLDKETLQELEDTLIQADLGIAVSERIIAAVSYGRYDKEIDPEEVKQILAEEVAKVLKPVEVPFNFGSEKPFVILVVGVNGSGKTTTIGKLGSIAASEGFKVMFAACDTFRAAAVEQLTVWGNRIGATTKSAAVGADSAGLAFDALKQAREDGTDILFIDTAGRLQNKTYLMDELDKVVRVIKKMDAGAPHAVLLVLDATTGQNALAQADVFTKVAGVTGLIMTKLDGTARGGILVAIAEKFKLPIHAIGVGESIDDLQPFDAQAFSRAIAGFEN